MIIFRKGFLYKTFQTNAILDEGVKPTLAELERFKETTEGLDIQLATVDKTVTMIMILGS